MLDVEKLQQLAALVRRTFQLTRDLVVFDYETTEPNPDTARVVEFGMVNVKADGTDKVYRTLVNPGVPIPKEASHGKPGSSYQGHGITDEMVQGCRVCGRAFGDELHQAEGPAGSSWHPFAPWPFFANLAKSIVTGFTGVDFAGTNPRFDLKVTRGELLRAGQVWDYDDANIVDVYRIEQIIEPRTLSDIYEKYFQKPFEGAHGALADVAASIEVLDAQFKRAAHLPRSLDQLHALCWEGWIDTDGKFKFDSGVPICNFGKNKGRPMREVDRGFYQWMLKPQQNFAPSTKRIAQDALIGKYPVSPVPLEF